MLTTVVARSRASSAEMPERSSLSRTSCSQPRSAVAHTCWISESVPSVSSAAAVTGQPSVQPADSFSSLVELMKKP
ncbi:hypothetical protein HUT18_10000 [Streptomyces sp. NA04227]|nr:hypothetical protein HUT18_10000 [Streptomyces sp. NA04227]